MSKPKGSTFTYIFALVLCLVCSLILSLSATALKPQQEANAKLDIAQNLLSAVGYEITELKKQTPEDVFKTFENVIETKILDEDNKTADRAFMEQELLKLGYPESEIKAMGSGELVRVFKSKAYILAARSGKPLDEYDPGYKLLYTYKPQDQVEAYIVPIEGYGLWDIIRGYIALEPDLNTVKGISFYENHETPGLGARITEDWFINSYKGKKVLNEQGELVSIKIAKGEIESAVPQNQHEHWVDGISGATLTGKGINEFIERDLKTYEPYFKTLRAE